MGRLIILYKLLLVIQANRATKVCHILNSLFLIFDGLLEHLVVQYLLFIELLDLFLMAYMLAELLASMEFFTTILAFELLEVHMTSFMVQAVSISDKSLLA